MIVVDTNIIAYLLINGDKTAAASRLLLADPDWHAPLLWRSELRNILSLYMRQRQMRLDEAHRLMDKAERLMGGNEHTVSSAVVLDLASESGSSAYDCEFAALARRLNCTLVSEDRRLLACFLDVALSMERFLAAQVR